MAASGEKAILDAAATAQLTRPSDHGIVAREVNCAAWAAHAIEKGMVALLTSCQVAIDGAISSTGAARARYNRGVVVEVGTGLARAFSVGRLPRRCHAAKACTTAIASFRDGYAYCPLRTRGRLTPANIAVVSPISCCALRFSAIGGFCARAVRASATLHRWFICKVEAWRTTPAFLVVSVKPRLADGLDAISHSIPRAI